MQTNQAIGQAHILSKSDHMKAVGNRLRQLIDALGIKYAQAARDMEIPKNHLGNWMRGEAYPLPFEMYRFCRIRGVNMDWVFLGDPSGLPHRVAEQLMQLISKPADQVEPENQASESPAQS
jgi:transcriptional regulator with XRE-family HTH domain